MTALLFHMQSEEIGINTNEKTVNNITLVEDTVVIIDCYNKLQELLKGKNIYCNLYGLKMNIKRRNGW